MHKYITSRHPVLPDAFNLKGEDSVAKWIKANGETCKVKPENGISFSLEELYRYANGGPIEVVCPCIDGKHDKMIIMKEKGKFIGLPINWVATSLSNNINSFIVGDVLFCDEGDIQ